MRVLVLTAWMALSAVAVGQPSGDAAGRYDGTWDTVVSCADSAGAMGYSYRFNLVVKGGMLHGEKGTKGQPGWFEINGRVVPDGVSHLLANGSVGAAQFAVGGRPAGTDFAYKVDAIFADDQGTGKRVEGRPCDLTFNRIRRGSGAQ